MNFCVDIGNTNTVIGVFKERKLIYRWRIATISTDTFDDIKSRLYPLLMMENLNLALVKKCIISSVVPMWNHSWERFSAESLGETPIFIGPGIKTGIKIAVDNPREVGADRIVNAVSAIESYPDGAVIVDSGTAITIDIVSPSKTYLGGTIMPGIMIGMDALASRTAKLGRVAIVRPERAVGKNTADSIRSGIYYGFAGMIDRVIEEILKEIDFKAEIISTGGLAHELSTSSKYIKHFEKDLTLKGLDLIANRL